MALFQNLFGGQQPGMQPAAPPLPRVPWQSNPMVTTAALSLLGGRNLNEGLANVAATAGQGMAAKTGMQQFMLAQQEAQAKKAEQEQRRAQMNEVMKAWPGLSPEQRALFSVQPELFGEFALKSMGGAGANEYGLTPVPGIDAEGNAVMLQLGKNGIATQAQMPEGVTISKTPIKLDAGTHYVLLDPITRQNIGTIPKDVAGQQSAEVQGTKQGEARANLPLVEATADRMIRTIDDALNDPALSRVTGPLQSWLPNVTGEANRAQSRLDQILGGTFLQAFNDLRGGGAITEKEGEKATDAYNRLTSTGMTDADYRKALIEFRSEVQKLVHVARRKAGAPSQAAPTPSSGREDEGGWTDLAPGVRIREVP